MTLWEVDLSVECERAENPLTLKLTILGDYDAESAVKAARDLIGSVGFEWNLEPVSPKDIESVSLRRVQGVCLVHAISSDVLKRGKDAFVMPEFD